MFLRYLISFYYWISMYLCSCNISGLKYKNSDNINYNHNHNHNHNKNNKNNKNNENNKKIINELEINKYNNSIEFYIYNDNNDEEQNIPLMISQSHRFPVYKCGFCNKKIINPEHMYNDKMYCTLKCRTNVIQREKFN